jgi:hypothetical protein
VSPRESAGPAARIFRKLYELVAELHARNTHARAENSLRLLVFTARHSTAETFSKESTLEKNSMDRSMSETVMPTASTDLTICARAGAEQKPNTSSNKVRTLTLPSPWQGEGKFIPPSPPRGDGRGKKLLLNLNNADLFMLDVSRVYSRPAFVGTGEHAHEHEARLFLQPFAFYTIRLIRCSPTRRAFAMMVGAGFTAPLEQKKLPSTT